MAVDIAIQGLVKLFVSGPGCAVSQIEDDQGRRFYTADTDGHLLRAEIETDPSRRLVDAARWPWYAQATEDEPPGELYFMRRRPGGLELRVTVHGTDYTVTYAHGADLIELRAHGARRRSRDVLALQGVGTHTSSLRIASDGSGQRFDITQRHIPGKGQGWRGIELRDARVGGNALRIRSIGDMQAFEVFSEQRRATYSAELKRYAGGALAVRPLGDQATAAGKIARFTPRDWGALEDTEVLVEDFGPATRRDHAG